jgi:hypothetical protein
MATRTVRLDEESERALAEIRQATGATVSRSFKQGLFTLRDALRGRLSATPYEIYRSLDLGPGGYSAAPARHAKGALRELLRRKRRR